MRDLFEGTTTSETPLAIWFDDETHEVGIQYGYVVVSLPLEDVHDLSEALAGALGALEG